MKRVEKIRLYPTARQDQALAFMLGVTRQLYNAALQERRDAYRLRRVSISANVQYKELTALRGTDALDRRLGAIYRECEDAVLHRLDLAMKAFFRRCKSGETPGRAQAGRFDGGDRAGGAVYSQYDQQRQRNGRETGSQRCGEGWLESRHA
jgi:transposase